jgi:hypothetical protein
VSAMKVAHRSTAASTLVGVALAITALLSPARASAQMGGMGGAGRAPQSQPTQTSPTRNNQVGPRNGTPSTEDDEDLSSQVQQRTEPTLAPPADPLAISPELRLQMGSDYTGGPPSPVGDLRRSFFPYYEESRGDYRLRMAWIPPLWLEQTRGLTGPGRATVPGEPVHEDRQSLFALLYYQRRSLKLDYDTLFPFVWRVRDEDSHLLVLGPFAHREAAFEHDNWLAPLYFEGRRKDGGYLDLPLLLTASHWSEKRAFTYSLLYFRDRKLNDVDWGVAPFVFHGDNGNGEGARRTYTAIPPLLFYHREREIDSNKLTIAGPVLVESSPKRDIVDVLPLYFHIRGNPETGGIKEEHTTLFPFFHYGETPEKKLFVVPGYIRRVTKTADTMVTPFVTLAETRKGATSLTMIGPLAPFYYHYRDRDIGLSTTVVAPFWMNSSSPEGRAFLTPLVGKFESYGLSKTWWVAPSFTFNSNIHGWENDFHPIVYLGRSDTSSHTVLAPVFWDFASPEGRTTIAAPVFFRFQNVKEGTITQVAANTVYLEKRVEGGKDWQFHLVPLFSYGEDPEGYFWNFLFGMAGYQREGSFSRIRALWIPITVRGTAPTANASAPPDGAAHF